MFNMAEDVGRPNTVTSEDGLNFEAFVLLKLEEAFQKGMNNRQACFLANVSERVFYDVLSKNEELSHRFESMKENTNIIAKNNIHSKLLDGDVDTSKWQLEKRQKEEYSSKQELDMTSKGEKIGALTTEEQAAIDKLLLDDKQESTPVPDKSAV